MWSTSSCIAVGCLPFIDGETDVTLGETSAVDPGGVPVFDGNLDTPNRRVVVSTVEWDTLLEIEVSDIRAHVKIWTNHPQWPDKVIVGVE